MDLNVLPQTQGVTERDGVVGGVLRHWTRN